MTCGDPELVTYNLAVCDAIKLIHGVHSIKKIMISTYNRDLENSDMPPAHTSLVKSTLAITCCYMNVLARPI